ncbi:MAG: hypothetical protein IPK17_13055 [Chloroflexi bacterium]|uniref:hypothetical protein n=1 Tax=Candidatus Flexifilum breve TaxID=3140694 RepID=UPI003136E909|nr:hypothetical protein [Chloroflexota bacterium]
MPDIQILSPRQTFEDNMRPAHLLLRVYRLLDSNDTIASDGDMVTSLRSVVQATAGEELLLIYNELFLGLVRERAQMHIATFKQKSLCHLLRQSVVASCTALDTYLPALLRTNLPIRIRILGRTFLRPGDESIKQQFKDLSFDLDEVLRLLDDPNAAEYLSTRILSQTNFSYLSSKRGIHVTAALLGVSAPWEALATHLGRDKKELSDTLEQTTSRRNDIIHRADRKQTDPGGDAQDITYAWAKHAVDTIENICLALDELVKTQVEELSKAVE